jgi:hypothetical protein
MACYYTGIGGRKFNGHDGLEGQDITALKWPRPHQMKYSTPNIGLGPRAYLVPRFAHSFEKKKPTATRDRIELQ